MEAKAVIKMINPLNIFVRVCASAIAEFDWDIGISKLASPEATALHSVVSSPAQSPLSV